MDVYSTFVADMENKLKISLTGEKDGNDLYSGWEINTISSNFNEIYYKNELLRTIEELIKSGTNPSDIWIFNKSIDIKKKYVNYKTGTINFNSTSSIKNLYFLGSPTPLYTNKKLMLLSIAFDGLRHIYSICNKYNINVPSREQSLNKILIDINQNNIEYLTEYFKLIVFEINDIKDNKLKNSINSEINNTIRNLDKDFFTLSSESFEDNVSFPKKLEKFNNFNNIFNSHERPVIVVNRNSILNTDSTILDILCFDFLVSEKFKKSNPRFLETNLISQNSPLIIGVTLGITIIPSLISILQKRKNVIETKKESYENSNRHTEKIAALDEELDSLNNELASLQLEEQVFETQLLEYKVANNITDINNPNNQIAISIINKNKEDNTAKGERWLKENKLELSSHEITNIQ